jgi:hypothetical protein
MLETEGASSEEREVGSQYRRASPSGSDFPRRGLSLTLRGLLVLPVIYHSPAISVPFDHLLPLVFLDILLDTNSPRQGV